MFITSDVFGVAMTPMDMAWSLLKGDIISKIGWQDVPADVTQRQKLRRTLATMPEPVPGGPVGVEMDQLLALLNLTEQQQAAERERRAQQGMEEARLARHARGENEPLGEAPPSPLRSQPSPVAVSSPSFAPAHGVPSEAPPLPNFRRPHESGEPELEV